MGEQKTIPFSKYLGELKEKSQIKGDLFDVSVSMPVVGLYQLSQKYSAESGVEMPIPQDIVVRKTPKKTSVRCTFPDTLDPSALNNAVIDLGLEKRVSIPDMGVEKTVIVIQ